MSSGPPCFAATKAFGDYFTPEDDPEHVVCTFSGGGAIHDYTMMDAMVALTAAYKAESKVIEAHEEEVLSIDMVPHNQGYLLVSGSKDNLIQIYDSKNDF